MRLLFLLLLSIFLVHGAKAQELDSILTRRDSVPVVLSDTLTAQKKKSKLSPGAAEASTTADSVVIHKNRTGLFKRVFVKNYPNPKVAALLSFVLPGAGQAYNKKWWKIPLVYGALGGMTYLAVSNDRQYKALRTNYKWLVDGDDNTNPTEEPYTLMTATQMKSYRDIYRGYTEKSYLFLGITYLLVVTDAFVDAHMASFDVSEDLTLKVMPAIQSGSGAFGASFGVGIRLGFGNSSKKPTFTKNMFASP